MSIEFTLPELGENIDSGEVVNLLVRPGDVITANHAVLELETDKAVVEVPCPHAGKIIDIHCQKGDTVAVGQALLTLDAEGEAALQESSLAKPPETETSATPREPSELESPDAPVASEQSSAPPSVTLQQRPPDGPEAGLLPVGPAARRLARELNVDLRQIVGTGRRGRITLDDVQAAAGSASAPQPAASPDAFAPPGESGQDAWGPIRRERMPRIRRTIAEQMSHSANIIPHVTNFDDADVTELDRTRKSVPSEYLGENVKLTTMPFVIKAVGLALRRHPVLNASIDHQRQEVVYKQYVNIGIAVDTPRGLVVPALRNVDRTSIAQIARDLSQLAQKARAAEFAIEDLRGGTFTVSNLGAIGGIYSTPIINHPEVAILLLGRSRWRPVVREGNVEPRLMMPLSLSYDHRLIDGAAAGRFLNEVIGYLQSPGKLMLTE